jgi:hypothetical protein
MKPMETSALRRVGGRGFPLQSAAMPTKSISHRIAAMRPSQTARSQHPALIFNRNASSATFNMSSSDWNGQFGEACA